MGARVTAAARDRATTPATRTVAERGDAHEREADRAADAVLAGAGAPSVSLATIPVLQRDEKPPERKSEEEKYKDAAKKAGEAFLQTGPGQEITAKAEQLGDTFISTLPGKIITGAAIAGAVTTLAATHRELPVGIPEISLDAVKPGLKMKLTYEGPVDKPTKVTATFSLPLAGASATSKTPAVSKSEQYRAETTRRVSELAAFREGLKTPEERERDRRLMESWTSSRLGMPGGPSLSFDPVIRPPGLGPRLPLTERKIEVDPLKLTGETQERPAEDEKKKEPAPVQRKASHADPTGSPLVVEDTLRTSGEPLDPGTRADMEARFGLDFSRVRIHTDAQAARSAEAVGALAYTVGEHLVFGTGRYSPRTADGRRLLAHELAHVIQQGGGLHGMALTPSRPRLASKGPNAPEPHPVEVAVNGDDDAVRALTNRDDWEFRVIRPDEAAVMLIHLLDGPTFDDDENAGLAILEKEIHQLMLDRTLSTLTQAGRFEQLLDDFDGAQYRTLLKLLSKNIQEKSVKATYLDAFIAMWWVREHEETAIVVLLERTGIDDQLALLREKNRIAELRKAIDSSDPRRRFETLVGSVNEAHADELRNRLSAIFEIDAKGSVAKGERTQAEVESLLTRAGADLAAELLHYQQRLEIATQGGRGDPDAITKINQEFERRLRGLVDLKKAEFGLELRYNLEFNSLLEGAYRRLWSAQDLKDFDAILQKIPPDLLHPGPDFVEFRRAAKHPTWAGTSGEGRITLFGQLGLKTTFHELGHHFQETDENGIHHDDPWDVVVFQDFAGLSEWERLTREQIMRQAGDDAERRRLTALLAKLDGQRDKDARNARETYDGEFYRYDRYPRVDAPDGTRVPTYYRYSKDARFVTDYARTDPQDDFCESFAYYVVAPEILRVKAPAKYEFMHVEVFTRERMLRQANRVLERFDARVDHELESVPDPFRPPFRVAYFAPLRRDLAQAMRGDRDRATRQAGQTVGDKPRPIQQAAAADAVAAPFLRRLDALFAVIRRVALATHSLEPPLELQQIHDIDPALADVQAEIGDRLTQLFLEELRPLVDAPARRALAGQAVDLRGWPELHALTGRYRQAIAIIPPYLPFFRTARGLLDEFLHGSAPKISRKFMGHPKQRDIVTHMVSERLSVLQPQVEAWKQGVVTRIRDRQPFDRKQVTDPQTILQRFDAKMNADATRIAAQRRAIGNGESAEGAEAAREAVDSPGRPLDDDTRGFMAAQLGRDFGDVRVHTGAQAAAGAAALDAQAFTVGTDIVYGDAAPGPDTERGRELLAHELTHVVQQDGATPSLDQGRDRPLPPLSFEQIDLPQTETANEGATDALAPVAASSPEGPPSEMPAPESIEAEPPMGENVVAATPVHPAAPSPLVVPPSHASEQEAERVSRAVVAADSERGPVPAIQRAGQTRVQRAPVAKKERPAGIDVVFIMGVDKNPKKNPFYREAVKYFKATHGTAALVSDDKHRSLESVFDYLRDRGERVANLYLVSHANEDGTLSFKLRNGDKEKDPHVQYGELVTALAEDAALFNLPKGVIDQETRIWIKGCNIGRSTRMLDALDQAFGAEGTVTAPTHKQVFGTTSTGRGKAQKIEHYEALQVYYLEYKGNQKITPAEQQAEFIAKYPELPEAKWKKWVPVDKRGRGGATRQPIAITYTYKFTIDVKNKATKRMAEEEALPKAIEWGDANIGRPEMFEWRIKSSVITGYGWFVTAVAEKTNYVVSKILVDETGKRLEPPDTDPKYFGTSAYGDEKKQAAAGGGADDTAALIAELASITAALRELEEGDERDEKLTRKRELDAELAKRSALIDVHVVKTEDWLGADEVYVTLGGGRTRFTSPVTKLNDGQSHTFLVPMTALMPADRPVTLQVYDEDLGWFLDRDDLIVTMDWRPPFDEAINRESLDEADYRVRAHL